MKIILTTQAPAFADNDGNLVETRAAVRDLRQLCGVTAADFGAIIGVSGRTVNGWEQGRPIAPHLMWRIRSMFTRAGRGDRVYKPGSP